MGVEVTLELLSTRDDWRRVGSVRPIDAPGSISCAGPQGRQVFMFGWADGVGPAVWRSLNGADVTAHDTGHGFDVVRVGPIAMAEGEGPGSPVPVTRGFEHVADLEAEPYELEWFARDVRCRLRFRAGPRPGP